MKNDLLKGDRIKFLEERYIYTVQAVSDNFAICTTKKMKIKGYSEPTFYYTILDFRRGVRNHDNYYTRFNYQNFEECVEALSLLEVSAGGYRKDAFDVMYQNGDFEVSERGPVTIKYTIKPRRKTKLNFS